MIRRLIQLAAATMVIASQAAAQATPVVLVHGFRSDSSTWLATADSLTLSGNYTPYANNTITWTDYLATQASTLVTYLNGLGLGGREIILGHSQGGLVSRLATRTDTVAGVLTIGSPHQGAPIVDAYPSIVAYLGDIDVDFYIAWDNLQDEVGCDPDPDVDPICAYVPDALYYLSPATTLVMGALTVGELYANTSFHDLADLSPGSGIIASLQDSASLEHVLTRYSIVVDDNDEGAGPFRLTEDFVAADRDAGDLSTWGLYLSLDGLGIETYDDPDTDDNYANHQAAGDALVWAGGFMDDFSDFWNGWVAYGDPNDGAVPTYSQQMPSSTPVPVYGFAHTEETSAYTIIAIALNAMTHR
jgi:pimeloyl-ACP methyl ester carboxylesterase